MAVTVGGVSDPNNCLPDAGSLPLEHHHRRSVDKNLLWQSPLAVLRGIRWQQNWVKTLIINTVIPSPSYLNQINIYLMTAEMT